MRVLVAPDCFGGTLTARAAAHAVAEGWRAAAPADELLLRPLADGGPGFVDVLHSALGGTLRERTVTGPLGEPVRAVWLEHEGTAYVESAQACGLHLAPADRRRPEEATSRGVGELLAAARDAGARTAVVGLGGSATTDGGAGALAALGATPVDAAGRPLPAGGGSLARCAGLAGRPDLGGLQLVAAADVENPLLGRHGAAHVFGPQKGADDAAVRRLEAGMAHWAEVLAAATGREVRDEPGAGAAGGLGAALLALGARRESGADLVRRLTGLDAAMDRADLVVTGEGSFDWQSLRGKLVTAVARGAAERGVPCLVLAGQVSVGRREAAAAGVATAYSVAEHVGSVAASLADPTGTLTALAADVAAQWSR
ncbi:glycerate kinase family protein [Streptoalloteichus hindustanus]|uniref:Glycerate kinase n=1 Tax=Streptoalloteichus hindustanus TaxID=2017 RepID=A0A1M5BSX6_STRHI|nr:glycerate kinase [Streptoalloteichus hindustanus]SHF45526.1 glycerate kinase [Streptoalloteichus hindustanus]